MATLPSLEHCIFSPLDTAHILLKNEGKILQLSVSGMESVAQEVELLAGLPIVPDRVKVFLQLQEAFNRLVWEGQFPKAFDRSFRKNRRLAVTLTALDGWISGSSQRRIAVDLFGEARVKADWAMGHDYLKSQVRRLIKRGRWLRDGGYRSLFR